MQHVLHYSDFELEVEMPKREPYKCGICGSDIEEAPPVLLCEKCRDRGKEVYESIFGTSIWDRYMRAKESLKE